MGGIGVSEMRNLDSRLTEGMEMASARSILASAGGVFEEKRKLLASAGDLVSERGGRTEIKMDWSIPMVFTAIYDLLLSFTFLLRTIVMSAALMILKYIVVSPCEAGVHVVARYDGQLHGSIGSKIGAGGGGEWETEGVAMDDSRGRSSKEGGVKSRGLNVGQLFDYTPSTAMTEARGGGGGGFGKPTLSSGRIEYQRRGGVGAGESWMDSAASAMGMGARGGEVGGAPRKMGGRRGLVSGGRDLDGLGSGDEEEMDFFPVDFIEEEEEEEDTDEFSRQLNFVMDSVSEEVVERESYGDGRARGGSFAKRRGVAGMDDDEVVAVLEFDEEDVVEVADEEEEELRTTKAGIAEKQQKKMKATSSHAAKSRRAVLTDMPIENVSPTTATSLAGVEEVEEGGEEEDEDEDEVYEVGASPLTIQERGVLSFERAVISRDDGSEEEEEEEDGEIGEREVVSKVDDRADTPEEEAKMQQAFVILKKELEFERSAAATAAEEAMMMIMRLQKEKSAIQMESKQHARVADERQAYDEAAMEIMTELLKKREEEKRILEKRIKTYKQQVEEFRGERQRARRYMTDTETGQSSGQGGGYGDGGDGGHHYHEEERSESKPLFAGENGFRLNTVGSYVDGGMRRKSMGGDGVGVEVREGEKGEKKMTVGSSSNLRAELAMNGSSFEGMGGGDDVEMSGWITRNEGSMTGDELPLGHGELHSLVDDGSWTDNEAEMGEGEGMSHVQGDDLSLLMSLGGSVKSYGSPKSMSASIANSSKLPAMAARSSLSSLSVKSAANEGISDVAFDMKSVTSDHKSVKSDHKSVTSDHKSVRSDVRSTKSLKSTRSIKAIVPGGRPNGKMLESFHSDGVSGEESNDRMAFPSSAIGTPRPGGGGGGGGARGVPVVGGRHWFDHEESDMVVGAGVDDLSPGKFLGEWGRELSIGGGIKRVGVLSSPKVPPLKDGAQEFESHALRSERIESAEEEGSVRQSRGGPESMMTLRGEREGVVSGHVAPTHEVSAIEECKRYPDEDDYYDDEEDEEEGERSGEEDEEEELTEEYDDEDVEGELGDLGELGELGEEYEEDEGEEELEGEGGEGEGEEEEEEEEELSSELETSSGTASPLKQRHMRVEDEIDDLYGRLEMLEKEKMMMMSLQKKKELPSPVATGANKTGGLRDERDGRRDKLLLSPLSKPAAIATMRPDFSPGLFSKKSDVIQPELEGIYGWEAMKNDAQIVKGLKPNSAMGNQRVRAPTM